MILISFYLVMVLMHGWSKLGDEIPEPVHIYIRKEMNEDERNTD